MSQSTTPSNSLGRNQGGGSVKRAREMLNAGIRTDENKGSDWVLPQASRPRPTHPLEHDRPQSQEAEIEIGFQVEHDPRGPVPIVPIQGLTVPKHAGPPPTSRRGQSSVYSRTNGSAISPIPEESPRNLTIKKASFASSMAIPTSWGSEPAMSDILDSYDSEKEEPKSKRDSLTVLRQASLGKRGKPSLRTISKPQTEALPAAEKYMSVDSGVGYSTVNGLDRRPSLDSVSTDTDSIDLEKERIEIENEQKSQKLGIGLGLVRPGAGMSSRKPNSHRPPQLDMNAVRAAEAHGSLTSLPDLIRRATKVASNLDRGKTASRLGILDMFDVGKESKSKGQGNPTHRTSASLSDILASFPPPRTGTPDGSIRSSWPFPPTNAAEKSRLREMETNPDDEAGGTGRPSRRYCGMSLPVLIFVCIIAFLIVAAAIIIPIILLVIVPHNKDHTTTASAASTTTKTACEQQLPCMNGGVSIRTGSSCSCVCVNGFSGTQCDNASDGSCTTIDMSESNNATIGNDLPAVFSESESYFSIYLNETDILGLLNSNNASCTVQNALVTFGGVSSKKRRGVPPLEMRNARHDAKVKRVEARATGTYVEPILTVPTATTSTSTATATAEGAMATTGTGTASTTVSSTSTSTSTAPSASVTVSATTARVYDFARVAVLFILEQTQDFSAAKKAQENIDLFLLSQPVNTAANTNMNMSVSDPETFVLSFTNFTITLSNGTVVGGGNGTAT